MDIAAFCPHVQPLALKRQMTVADSMHINNRPFHLNQGFILGPSLSPKLRLTNVAERKLMLK